MARSAKLNELQNYLVNNLNPIHVVYIQETCYLDNSKQHRLIGYQRSVVKNRKLNTNKTKGGGSVFKLKKDCSIMRRS